MTEEYTPTRQDEFTDVYVAALQGKLTGSVNSCLLEEVSDTIATLEALQSSKFAHEVYASQLRELKEVFSEISHLGENQDVLEVDEDHDILEQEEADILEGDEDE